MSGVAAGARATKPAAVTGLRVDGEIGWLRRVLVCSPGEELRRVPPDQRDRYLMEDVLWLERAREQHAAFTHALETLMHAAPGGTAGGVVDLREELARVLGSGADLAASTELLDEIVSLEAGLRPSEADGVFASLRALVGNPRGRLVDDLLAGILIDRPAPGRDLFQICPSPNVMFARDYQFVLGGGAFLSSMAKQARWKEPALARFLFNHALGLHDTCFDLKRLSAFGSKARQKLEGTPGELSIEGGDVMALSRETIVVGISERTTWRGATALVLGLRWLKQLSPAQFPFTEICAVELPSRRAMMHLDTVFTLIDRGLALAYPPLTFPGSREEMPVLACSLAADPDAPVEWQWVGPFSSAMSRRLSSEGRPLTLVAGGGHDRTLQHREQWCDACNAFAVGPGVAVSYKRNGRTLESLGALDQRALLESGALVIPGAREAPAEHLRPFQVIDAAELSPRRARALIGAGERVMVGIDGGELGRARGGPHCMTMALYREADAFAAEEPAPR